MTKPAERPTTDDWSDYPPAPAMADDDSLFLEELALAIEQRKAPARPAACAARLRAIRARLSAADV